MPAISIGDLNNAKLDVDHIAEVALSTRHEAIDRRGGHKKTITGMLYGMDRRVGSAVTQAQIDLNAVVAGLGYLPPVEYDSGIVIDNSRITVTYDGATYAPVVDELPFTTSGTFEEDKFRLIDGIKSTDIQDTDGSGMAGVLQVLDNAKPMQNYTALRAYTGRATGVRITTPGLAGFFYRDDGDTTTDDNGGTVIVDVLGRRWWRLHDGVIFSEWWGFDPDADDSVNSDALVAALTCDEVQAGAKVVLTPGRTYPLNDDVVVQDLRLRGEGARIKYTGSGTAIRVGGQIHHCTTELSVDAAAGARSVTLDDVDGIEVGDIISIVGGDNFHPDRWNTYKTGLTAIVRRVNTTTKVVHLSRAIPMATTAEDSRVVVFPPVLVDISDVEIVREGTVVGGTYALAVIGADERGRVMNIRADGFSSNVAFHHCVGCEGEAIETLRAYYAGTATSYGVVVYSSTGVVISRLRAQTGRHGYATGAHSTYLPSVAGADDRACPNVDLLVRDSLIYPEVDISPATGGGENGFDCHPGTYSITIENSTLWRFQLAAEYAAVRGCRILGRANQSSLLSYMATNGEYLFDSCVFEGMGQIELKGFEMPEDETRTALQIASIRFVNCSKVGDAPMRIYLGMVLGETDYDYKVGAVHMDSCNGLIVSAKPEECRVEEITFNEPTHMLATSLITHTGTVGQRIGKVRVVGGRIRARWSVLLMEAAQRVDLDHVGFVDAGDVGDFSFSISDDANVTAISTKLDYGSGGNRGGRIGDQGGGGTLTFLNSPIHWHSTAVLDGFTRISSWPT